jgi:hypothetical protein
MHFEEVQVAVVEILRAAKGHFLSAYQICHRLKANEPELWARLVAEYPSVHPDIPMGEGTGKPYSPASFIANALNSFKGDPLLQKELFDCEGISFGATDPGATVNSVGIWAIKN